MIGSQHFDNVWFECVICVNLYTVGRYWYTSTSVYNLVFSSFTSLDLQDAVYISICLILDDL